MSLADNILKRIDINSGADVNYIETTTWYDGSPIDDSKVFGDGNIYRKKGNKYYRKVIASDLIPKVDSIAQLRNFNAYFEGQAIELLGYYNPGDKPTIKYKFTVNDYSTYIDDGGNFVKTSKGTWIAQFNNKINVKDFGAVGDGVTDDTDAIQRAFNATWEKSTVYFPVGFYRVEKQINIPIDKEIVIEGEKSVSDGGATPETRFNGMSSILWFGEDLTDTCVFKFLDTQSRVRMRYLTFSNRTSRTDIDGLFFQDFRGAYLEYVYLNQFRNNIWIEGDCWYAKLEKCKLMQSKENGIYVKGLANGLKFEECRISSNLKRGVFFLKAASDITLDGCYIEQNLEEGLYFTQPQLINITKCHFENNGYEVVTNPSQIYVGNYTDLNNTDVSINLTGNYIFSRGGINIIHTNAGTLGTGSKIVSNVTGNYISVTNNTKGNTCYFIHIIGNANNNLISANNNVYKSLSPDVNTPTLTNVAPTALKGFTAVNDNSVQTDSISLKTNRVLSNRVQFTDDFSVLGASIVSGTGTPEGNSVSNVGSIYMDNTPSTNPTDRLYSKQTGTGNTGWVKVFKDVNITVDSIAQLRNFNGTEGQVIELLGYYSPGDKPLLKYKYTLLNFGTLVDDGGSIIKTTSGSWIAQFNNQINVKDFGLIDNGTTDNAATVTQLNNYLANNASAVESQRLKVLFPYSSNYYKSTVPLVVPAFVDLRMDGVLLYSGTPDVTAITIGSSGKVNAKTSLKINVRGETISWLNNTYEGFRIINLQSSTNVEIVQSVGFSFGGTLIGSTNAGFVYNKITLGQLANNKTDLKLTNFGNGWINENLFEGGRFQRTSSINPTSDKYGIIITSEDGVYTNNNNNNFYKPSFEYNYSGTGETIPVVIEHGVQNSFKDVRFESGEVPCAIKTLNSSTDNVFEIGYLGVSSFNYSRLAQDLGLFPNTRTFARKNGIRHSGNKYLVYNSDYLTKKLFSKNGTHVYAPDEMFIVTSGSASNSKNSTAGITINSDYITINASTGLGVRVDTSQNKRFVINKYIKTGGRPGRIMVRCYNSSGTILTNDKVYVRGEATAVPVYFASYGSVYRLGSDANTNWFINLHDDVAYIDVIIAAGTNPCDLVSFSIEALDFPTSIIDPYNKKGWYATEAPTTTSYETGTIVYNTVQTLGRISGWIYNGTTWVEIVPDPLNSVLQYNDDFNL